MRTTRWNTATIAVPRVPLYLARRRDFGAAYKRLPRSNPLLFLFSIELSGLTFSTPRTISTDSTASACSTTPQVEAHLVMLAKNILSVMALGMYALLTVDAGMVQKRDEDPDRNPTNFALFDPYDNPVMPRAKCTVQEADTRT